MTGLAFVDQVFFRGMTIGGRLEGLPRVSDTGQNAAVSQAPRAHDIGSRKDDRNCVLLNLFLPTSHLLVLKVIRGFLETKTRHLHTVHHTDCVLVYEPLHRVPYPYITEDLSQCHL